jgi:hypothetical protein
MNLMPCFCLFFLVSLALPSSHALGEELTPTVVKKHLALRGEITISHHNRIQFKDGERAFVAIVASSEDARFETDRLVLFRPGKGEARSFDASCWKIEVFDLDGDGTSEFLLTSGFVQGGYSKSKKRLCRFIGWDLECFSRFTEESDNGGMCDGEEDPCVSTSTELEIGDLNGDGIKDIAEVLREKNGNSLSVRIIHHLYDGRALSVRKQ